MKTNFTSFPLNTIKFFALAIFALLLVNCSNDDAPVVYDFEEDFADLDELPEVEDEDPIITEPDAGKVNNSAETQAIVSDLNSGNVSAETQTKLNSVDSFVPAELEDEAQNLDENGVEAILNTTAFTGDIAALKTALENAPAEIVALLPSIEFSADFQGRERVSERLKSGIVVDFSNKEFFAQSQNAGTCRENANKAYNDAMAAPIAKRDSQLATIAANYTRRLGEAEARHVARQAALDAARADFREDLKQTAVDLITAANDLTATDADLAGQIKELALIFTVSASSDLNEWYSAASNLILVIKGEEKAVVVLREETKTAEVLAAFTAIKNTADSKLTSALNKCHNQGSGS